MLSHGYQSTNFSFTELMTSALGDNPGDTSWEQYGAFLAHDARVPYQRVGDAQPSGHLPRGSSDQYSDYGSYSQRTTSLAGPSSSTVPPSPNVPIPLTNNVQNDELPVYSEAESEDNDGYEDEDGYNSNGNGDESPQHSPEPIPVMDATRIIPFLSDIGTEKDHMIDDFNDHPRPVWLDDTSSDLEVGMVFKTKEMFQHAVRCCSVRAHRYFKVHESTPNSWYVKCLYFDEGTCLWRVRGKLKKNHGFFEITRMHNVHTCNPEVHQSDHPNLDSNMVGRIVQSNVQENALYKVVDVATDVRKFGVDISYKKAWLGKNKAIERVYGNWETSYNVLPRYLLALQCANPGTIVEWRNIDTTIEGPKIFHSVFWAFKASIDGFVHCRPVVTVDGTHQYGKYKEKILIACGVDAANHIFPLAFATVDEENLSNWAWFLHNLVIHVFLDRQGICMISDRHRGTLRAIELNTRLQPPYVHHRFCCRHVQSNFSARFKNAALTNLMERAARSHQIRKFEQCMTAIKDLSEPAHKWLRDIPPELWTLSHDGGFRYGIMTTNNSESFNSVLKGARKLPVTACVEATFNRLVKYFDNYRTEADKHIGSNDPWPRAVAAKFCTSQSKSRFHRVTAFNRTMGLYQVTTGVHGDKGNNAHTVNLTEKSCTCGKLQIYKIPCSHVQKVCDNMGRTAIDMVDRAYSCQSMVATYSGQFFPLMHEDYWPPTPFHLVANSDRLNDRVGRPRSQRFRNEMDTSRMKRCKACGDVGHTQKVCPKMDELRARAALHR